MAEKISMIIVMVDLDCHKCYDKMRKILCKLQDQERIRTISFDDKSKTIAIAGPFDPQRLACKIRCKGGKVVKDIQIVDVGFGDGNCKPPPPPPMVAEPPSPSAHVSNNCRKKQKGKPAPAAEPPSPQPPPPETAPAPQPPEMPPTPPPQPGTPDREMASTMPAFHEEDKQRARPADLEPPPPPSPNKERPPPPMEYYMPPQAALPQPSAIKPTRLPTPPPPMPCPKPAEQYHPAAECVIPTVEIPSWSAAPAGPCGCPCCAPCYQGYYEGCKCGCGGGGRMYGYGWAPALPPPAVCYGYRGCRIINEEDPNAACSIM